MFEYGSSQWGTPVTLLRLNYAVELRYGVLVDIALAVFSGRPVDLRMGQVNVIWQRDANSACLRSLAHCQSPPLILNLTGPETLSVREIAEEFGHRFHVQPIFTGEETGYALLSNAATASPSTPETTTTSFPICSPTSPSAGRVCALLGGCLATGLSGRGLPFRCLLPQRRT
jgi:hypothetical protein